MTATIELLRAVKRRHALTSDYQLHKHLNVSKQAISAYMAGDVSLGDDIAVRVADDLQLDAAAVLAAVAAERTKSARARAVLRDAVKRLGGIAATAILAVGAATLGMPSPAAAGQLNSNGIASSAEYTLRNKRRRLFGLLG